MAALLRRSGANLNQIARRVNQTGRVYDTDLEDIRQGYEKLWDATRKILTSLAAIQ